MCVCVFVCVWVCSYVGAWMFVYGVRVCVLLVYVIQGPTDLYRSPCMIIAPCVSHQVDGRVGDPINSL